MSRWGFINIHKPKLPGDIFFSNIIRMSMRRNSLALQLNRLLDLAKTEDITIRTVIQVLAGRGQAILIILFSLPFCLPIQIPGLSTPFGLLIAIIGLRIAFGHRVWIPRKLLDEKIAYNQLEKIASVSIKLTNKLRYLISTRLTWLVKYPAARVIHGLTITFLGLFLALPLPLPFTNLLAAFPLLAFGLALLEDDGVFIIIAYLLTFFSLFIISSALAYGTSWLLSKLP